MMKLILTRHRLFVIAVTILLLIMVSSVSYAWFVMVNRTDSFIATAAKVDVDIQIDLDGTFNELEYFEISDWYTMTKTGVYEINVTDQFAENFLTNLRINILVNSTVDTYVRVSIIDSLTLATIDFEGNRGEVAIVDQPIPYAFDRSWLVNGDPYEDLYDAEVALGGITAGDTVEQVDHWYDHSIQDGYYYYPMRIGRSTVSSQLTLPFIEEYDGLEFETKSFGYTLQFAIIVEAIQAANDAPIYNWGLSTPPWGGTWS